MTFYKMVRDEDATGCSGIGTVGEVAVFSDGAAVLRWSEKSNAVGVSSMAIYTSFEDLVKVHGHNGKTRFVEVQVI